VTFRIFTNDRGKQKGVYMYSAFKPMEADSAKAAEEAAERRWGPFAYRGAHGPVKAIQWPPVAEVDKQWLAKHVGENRPDV
jgi:hypothetical protein